uniref:AarF domain containing kinase 1 n=2 Tax=Cyprinus carpio TaxID=7962 RepID=A0A9J7Y9L2_CYPCA
MPGNNSSAISIAVSQRPFEQLRQVHRRSAERLQDLCCSNRGTFIKVGQHLGALDYLLPEGYTSTMKVLHSRAPQSSMEEIRPVIREDLGKEDVDIRTNVALYLPQISELLNRIPRQMLLPLKTNNLLRGIETILQTRASSSSFINISRCCTRAIARLAFSGKTPG